MPKLCHLVSVRLVEPTRGTTIFLQKPRFYLIIIHWPRR
jgi:hypothetical protein